MSIQERHEREREAVRRRILDAARDLFVARGVEHVSLRKVAERIEYSPSAIYGYFPSKDDIFLELAEEGFRLLERFTEPRETDDPIADLRDNCLRYYQFSKTHPEYFSLIFLESLQPIIENRERFAFLGSLQARGVRLVRRCVEAGRLPATTDAEVANSALWAAIHGPAVIGMTWRTPMAEYADVLATNVVDTVLAGLAAGCPLRGFEPTAVGVRTGVRTGEGGAGDGV